MARFISSASTTPYPTIDPQRRAWGIMLVAFAVFCTICLVTGLGTIYFLFQSTVPLESVMQVGRGTGGISNQEAARTTATVTSNDRVSTDQFSQATVYLRDPENDTQLITAITLRGDTSVKLLRGSRPRFRWSNGEYTVELQEFSGELIVYAPKQLAHQLNLSIITNAGDLIYLRSGGQYILRASDSRVQVINQDGDVILKPANIDIGKSVSPNGQGIITYATNPDDVVVSQAYTNLVSDGVFQDALNAPSEGATDTPPFKQDWFCKDNSVPQGMSKPEVFDGRTILRLLRADNATSHGETGCVRSWGDGQNIASFNYLNLRATFRINYQSLSLCGEKGSECPLMLVVDYRRENDDEPHTWYHGFYTWVDPNRNFPLQCDSCLQLHEQINEKAWFTYDSGNLLNLLTNPQQLAEQRPISIIDIQFKASGHQYDVAVSDVSLLADIVANP